MARYNPGEEPDVLAKKVRSFFNRIDEYYPDRQIIRLHTDHKKLGERLTQLYRELGYESGEEMMKAYGYTYVQMKRKPDSDEVKKARKEWLIAELKRRYPNGSDVKSVVALTEANPDLSKEIKKEFSRKEELVKAGILLDVNEQNKAYSEKYEQLCLELREMILTRFPEGSQWCSQADLIFAIPDAKPYIEQIKTILELYLNKSFNREMLEQGIFVKPVKPLKKAVHPDIMRGDLERMYLLGESDKSLSYLTRQSFGMSYSDYKQKRERIEPEGSLGKGIQLLKEILPNIEKAADKNKCLSLQKIKSSDVKKLIDIVDKLGYPDVQTLLTSYGYIIEHTPEEE